MTIKIVSCDIETAKKILGSDTPIEQLVNMSDVAECEEVKGDAQNPCEKAAATPRQRQNTERRLERLGSFVGDLNNGTPEECAYLAYKIICALNTLDTLDTSDERAYFHWQTANTVKQLIGKLYRKIGDLEERLENIHEIADSFNGEGN